METTLTIVGVSLGAALGLGVLVLLGIVARNTFKDPRRQQRARARPSPIAGITPGETVAIVGRIRAAGDLLVAPFSARRCVGYQAAIERDVDPDDPDTPVGGIRRHRLPAAIVVEDETGTVSVALSRGCQLAVDRVRSVQHHAVPMSDVDRYLADLGATYDDIENGFPFGAAYNTLPADYRAVEWLLNEGDLAHVIGKASAQPDVSGRESKGSYREPPRQLVIDAEGELPVQLDLREATLAATKKKAAR